METPTQTKNEDDEENEEEEDESVGEEWISIKLDDRIYTTELSTILSDKESMLYVMFCKKNRGKYVLKKDDDHYLKPYLFDRSGKYFEYIIEYLRTGDLIIDEKSTNVNKMKLLKEAEYFNINGIIMKLKPLIEKEENEKHLDLTRKEVIKILVKNESKKSLRFQGLNLRGINLSFLDLSYINFSGSNLSGSILDNATMNHVDLRRADLSGASLKKVSICNALAMNCNMKCINLENATCVGTNFEKANIQRGCFKSCELSRCNFTHSDLSFCDFEGSNLHACCFKSTNLKNINRKGTNLSMGGVIRLDNL